MDASDAVYYPLPTDHEEPGNDSKHCSVRGCTNLVTNGSTNKMCDVCRSRHRIYASTKRARRKLEKAAVANAVAARGGRESMVVNYPHSVDSPPVVIATSWVAEVAENANLFNEGTSTSNSHQLASGASSSASPTSLSGWNSIDPRLFAENSVTSPMQHVHLHQSSSTSELANALTLPLPRPEIPSKPVAEAQSEVEEKQEQAINEQHTLGSTGATSSDSSGVPTRFCSVKGCKAVLPATYQFKMCPPCRTRYRTYGYTKRAKWKTERAAFDHEMADLRALEDKRRENEGLAPLADNPDELRAWELSILDEQIPTSEEATSRSLAPSTNASPDPVQQVASSSTFPPEYAPPIVTAGVYPATIGSIDTPHSISPYPHLNNPLLVPMVGPLPARMCTVSHCHKVLPGYYRYKRCEQHRLQNRHHSKLKRVREKEIKVLGPEDDAEILDAVVSGDTSDMKSGDEAEPSKPKKTAIQKGKEKEVSSFEVTMSEGLAGPSSPNDSAKTQQWPSMSIMMPQQDGRKASGPKSREEMQKRSKSSCVNDDCHNLLTPGIRWRTCDECRNLDRLRKATVQSELKAAEDVYWKGVAQTLRIARLAGEAATSGSTSAVSSGSFGGANTPVLPTPSVGGDEDDAEGDSDVEGDGEDMQEFQPQLQIQTQPQPQSVVETTPLVHVYLPQPPTWRTRRPNELLVPPTTHSPTFNSLTKQVYAKTESIPIVNGAFSKFRVELTSNSTSSESTSTLAPVVRCTNGPIYSGFLPNIPLALSDTHNVSTGEQPAVSLEKPQSMESNPQADSQNVKTPTASPAVSTFPMQTATIPTSAPFVYSAPTKQVATDLNKKGKASTKGKRKSASKEVVPISAMLATTMPANSLSAPPTPFGPYGFPTSYPYYPYYVPPFPYPPTLPMTKNGSSQPSASSSALPHPVAPPSYFPYPYPPPHLTQPYGFGSPPGAYPYLPPRYTTAGYSSISGQQPYPGLPPPPGPYQGYPFYLPRPGLSVSAPPAVVATSAAPSVTSSAPASATSASVSAPTLAPLPPTPKGPEQTSSSSTDPTFTHYHFVTGDSYSPTDSNKPVRKRRKVDPNYLEKYKALQAESLLSINGVPPSPSVSLPESSVANASRESTVDCLEQSTNSKDSNSESRVSNPQTDYNPRSCVTKTCRRTIPAEVTGTICEKCKLRFKKYQAKAKRKFKLEPRKFIVTKDRE